ncbi:MAG TPA: PIG-L deacetylase family protein [Gemmatimonadales bacterium]|nr:PIG-L deacetylase family protein [Gemmatimonadales bacterium]
MATVPFLETASFAPLLPQAVPRRVLAIAAHPDDEVLGCGGTLALHARAGDEVTVIIACDGEEVRYEPSGVGRPNPSHRAAAVLGLAECRQLGFPDQRLDTISLLDLIRPLEHAVRSVRPSVVYCQFGSDGNRDHEQLFQASLVATRPLEACIEGVYVFDTANSTEWGYPRAFVPDTWVDISETLEQKLNAMSCYEREVRPYPHPRSLDALRHRGRAWGNQCCMDAAEVFMTVRRTLRAGRIPG